MSDDALARAGVTEDANGVAKLKREAEKAKRTLSSQMSTRIEIEVPA